MDCSTPGFPVPHQLPELAQTHVHRVGDAIQLSYPLLSPFPPAFNLFQHQGLFQWVSPSHQVAKVLELQLVVLGSLKIFLSSPLSAKVDLYQCFQFSSVSQSCLTLCDPIDCSTLGFPVYHQLPELAQTPVHWVGDAIQSSHPLSSPFPPAFNLFQHQGLFKWISSSRQVDKVLEFQLQHQSFQWTLRTDLL